MELWDLAEMYENTSSDLTAEVARLERAHRRGEYIDLVWYGNLQSLAHQAGAAKTLAQEMAKSDVCVLTERPPGRD